MKKAVFAYTVFSILGLASVAQAATTGGSGMVNFTGTVNNDACTISGATGQSKSINVEMGNVPIKDMGSAANPQGGMISQHSFEMNVNCNQGTKVSMRFSPSTGGPGVVNGTGVLALTPGIESAKGVGIALIDINGNLIDLSTPATAKIEGSLQGTAGGNTTLRFAAAYVTTGSATAPGVANSTLPFILEYE